VPKNENLSFMYPMDKRHGRQFWWALSEFWTFDSVDERMRAANLTQRFNVLFRNHAKSLGFALDMTFDLARIMRIPGTMNYKSIPVPVKLFSCSDARYHVDDMEMYVPEMGLSPMFPPPAGCNGPWRVFHSRSDGRPTGIKTLRLGRSRAFVQGVLGDEAEVSLRQGIMIRI